MVLGVENRFSNVLEQVDRCKFFVDAHAADAAGRVRS